VSFTDSFSDQPLQQLLVCALVQSDAWLGSLKQFLAKDRYQVVYPHSVPDLFRLMEHSTPPIDCLLLEENADLLHVLEHLHQRALVLPAVIIRTEDPADSPISAASETGRTFLYHSAEVRVPESQADAVTNCLDRAIAEFLNFSPACRLKAIITREIPPEPTNGRLTGSIVLQQQRLMQKLKERLGYLGVYYQRNPHHFLRNLPSDERSTFLVDLEQAYREIILRYFTSDPEINQKIDAYVDTAFFADVPIAKVVEIHMDLMDEFSKQLRLEGRSEDILLDYRLALIDTLAHLCELYRRSIPRESPES
jgi:circadian clock protein KaiA